jgi:hypothetical protein
MSKKSLLPQKPRHILVYDEDWEFIYENYGPYSESRRGTSSTIRDIIHIFVRRLKAKATDLQDAAGASAKTELESET